MGIWVGTNKISKVYGYDGGSTGTIEYKNIWVGTNKVLSNTIPSELFRASGSTSEEIYSNAVPNIVFNDFAPSDIFAIYSEVDVQFIYKETTSHWSSGWLMFTEEGFTYNFIDNLEVEGILYDNGGVTEIGISSTGAPVSSYPPKIISITCLE